MENLEIIKNFLLNLHWYNFLDFAVVALLIYFAYRMLKGSASSLIFIAIMLIIALWRIVILLNMPLTAAILGSIINVGIIALIIVFQPEIRRFLMLLGSGKLIGKKVKMKVLTKLFRADAEKLNIQQIVLACKDMSKNKTGALIVLAKENDLDFSISTGESLDSLISAQLIENIFFKNSPLHDGAIIIKDNRIVAARCILPVSENPDIPASLGLRHRAAFGITEQTDAIALVVSEQTGNISIVKNGVIDRNISSEKLTASLTEEFKAS